MNPKRFSLILMLALALLSACGAPAAPATVTPPPAPSQPAETPSATPGQPVAEPTATENDTPIPFPADTAVLTWHREGGIAGFCDDLTVYAGGAYTVVNCVALPGSQRNGQLDADQLKQLTRWVNKFESYQTPDDTQLPVHPDAMLIKLTFKGVGSLQPGDLDLADLNAFASALVTPPASSGDGSEPQAVSKAREFVAGELGIAVESVSVISFESVEWPDRCLGVIIKGQMCAQGVTPGYRIILEAQGQTYEVHTDETGESLRQVQQ